MVKGIYNFLKVRELIDGFNKSRRHIASGVGKKKDESTSVICFRTTPKRDLPHYLYIFRKTETLGSEMKNVSSSRFGPTLHLEIQKEKEAMKTSNFQKDIKGAVA